MKIPDTVDGVLDPYLNRFELWDNEGRQYQSGDSVPNVGMASTYAIQFQASADDAKPMFLWVQENKITNVMALQPIGLRSVFDQRGMFLGTGGEQLDAIQAERPEPVDIITAIKNMDQPAPAPLLKEIVHEPTTPPPEEPVQLPTSERSINDLVNDLKELTDEVEAALPEPEARVHRFHLRDDFEVRLELPDDLTEAEAKRLALFISALPIPEDEDTV